MRDKWLQVVASASGHLARRSYCHGGASTGQHSAMVGVRVDDGAQLRVRHVNGAPEHVGSGR